MPFYILLDLQNQLNSSLIPVHTWIDLVFYLWHGRGSKAERSTGHPFMLFYFICQIRGWSTSPGNPGSATGYQPRDRHL